MPRCPTARRVGYRVGAYPPSSPLAHVAMCRHNRAGSPAGASTAAALPDRDTIVRSLAAEGGNVARTARVLGLHRNQLRRFLARHPDVVTGES